MPTTAISPILILASGSQRRKELLTAAGLSFEVIVSNAPEVPLPGEAPMDYVKRNASLKARAVLDNTAPFKKECSFILAADTIVVNHANAILEKPQSPQHARDMLISLSGKWHSVHTGFAIMDASTGKLLHDQVVTTRVQFRALNDSEIASYIKTGEPFDKAGGYGAQGPGCIFIRTIKGSYTNVIGLPMCEVVESLSIYTPLTPFTAENQQ